MTLRKGWNRMSSICKMAKPIELKFSEKLQSFLLVLDYKFFFEVPNPGSGEAISEIYIIIKLIPDY